MARRARSRRARTTRGGVRAAADRLPDETTPPPTVVVPTRFQLSARLSEVSVAFASLTLAVTLAGINAYYAMRGAEIAVQVPQQVVLFRDGDGAKSVLTLAMRVGMANKADAGNGDVLTRATLVPFAGFAGIVSPITLQMVFGADPAVPHACPEGSRCIVHRGLKVIEQPETILDIPGGGTRSTYLSFPVAAGNCAVGHAGCAALGTFDRDLRLVSGRPLDIRLTLHFDDDGERVLACRTRPIDVGYLTRFGWMTMNCEEASVSGGRVF